VRQVAAINPKPMFLGECPCSAEVLAIAGGCGQGFGLDEVPSFLPRCDVVPSQPVGAIVRDKNTAKKFLTDYISSQFERI
jgi:hypothetical protein